MEKKKYTEGRFICRNRASIYGMLATFVELAYNDDIQQQKLLLHSLCGELSGFDGMLFRL